jgi:replicative DNA helicase
MQIGTGAHAAMAKARKSRLATDGISVLPVTPIDLRHAASVERISTGIPALDSMLGGKGYFRGSSIQISGTAGTEKTSMAAHFADAACSRGERCIMFFSEESADQTAIVTTLTGGAAAQEQTDVNMSSLVDTWLLLRDIESRGERNRGLYILKSRGAAHSNQIREFLLTDHGMELRNVYLGKTGLLTGSARVAQEAEDASQALLAGQEIETRQCALDRNRKAIEAQMDVLRLELETEAEESKRYIAQEKLKLKKWEQDQGNMAKCRA